MRSRFAGPKTHNDFAFIARNMSFVRNRSVNSLYEPRQLVGRLIPRKMYFQVKLIQGKPLGNQCAAGLLVKLPSKAVTMNSLLN